MMHLLLNVNEPKPNIKTLLVRIFIRSPVFHTELQFSDGSCFSSDPSDGVRYKKIPFDPYQWIKIPLPWITPDDEERIRLWCNNELGCEYDWMGAVLGMINHRHQNDNKWFCSEICAAAIRPYTPILKKDYWYNPRNLWEVVSDYYVEYQEKNYV